MPQKELQQTLSKLSLNPAGLDSAIISTLNGTRLVQTTDFFYPLVDDPYYQGKIAAANVLSDLYALGVTKCDSMLMLLGVCRNMPEEYREIVTTEMMRGFNDVVTREASSIVTGGQTVWNPWYIIGGVASSVVLPQDIIHPTNGVEDDVLVLTKPLGIRMITNLNVWLRKPEKYSTVEHLISRDEINLLYQAALNSMSRLNLVGAQLMKKYGAHGATDVTGFGILGHAENLVSIQKNNLDFVIHSLPLFEKLADVDKVTSFKMLEGYSAETSGGLLIMMEKASALEYMKEIKEIEGCDAYIIGDVVKGTRKAILSRNLTVISVPFKKENQI